MSDNEMNTTEAIEQINVELLEDEIIEQPEDEVVEENEYDPVLALGFSSKVTKIYGGEAIAFVDPIDLDGFQYEVYLDVFVSTRYSDRYTPPTLSSIVVSSKSLAKSRSKARLAMKYLLSRYQYECLHREFEAAMNKIPNLENAG